jgi:hypothetical protein
MFGQKLFAPSSSGVVLELGLGEALGSLRLFRSIFIAA